MRERYLITGLLVIISIFIFTSCSNEQDNSSDNQDLLIFTSIYPIEFITAQIAGDVAHVKSIYPPGVDAHTYEPKTKEITAIANADAFFYIGSGMESFSESVASSLQNRQVQLIEIGKQDHLFLKSDNEDDNHHHDLDPHIWLDPLKMIAIAALIKEELINISPENEGIFTNQFKELEGSLQKLDEDFQNTLSQKSNKKILVTHAAYSYWENRYDLEQIAISGLSSSEEPSQRELANITKLAMENNIQYVLFEQTSSNRIASIVQEHIGAESLTIHPLEVLTEEDIKQNETYITLMYKNLDTLDKAMK